MAEQNVAWNVYINPNKYREEKYNIVTDKGIEEQVHQVAGVEELGYVDPDTGALVFESELVGDGDLPAGASVAPAAEPSKEKKADLEAQPAPDLPLEVAGEE